MASPVKIYHYQQTSAPALTNSEGSMHSVLTGCLVNGFNSQTISTLSVTNNVATATFSGAHGYLAFDSILISGANESQFNDSWMVKTVPDSTTLTFDITTADVTATGTITCKIAPLGWSVTSHPTTSYLKFYRAPTGNRHYFSLLDNSDRLKLKTTIIDNREDPFYFEESVNDTPKLNSVHIAKYENQNVWYLIGTDKFFYLIVKPYTSRTFFCNCFGDIKPFFNMVDNFGTILYGNDDNSTPTDSELFNALRGQVPYDLDNKANVISDASQLSNSFFVKDFSGVFSYPWCGLLSYARRAGTIGNGTPMVLVPILVFQVLASVEQVTYKRKYFCRGCLPGALVSLNTMTYPSGFSTISDSNGKTILVFKTSTNDILLFSLDINDWENV